MMLSPELNFGGIKLRICSRLEQLRRWWEGPLSLEEIELIAWHAMLNDPYLSTYVMIDGKEVRTYVNPKLAYQRMLIEMGEGFQRMAEDIMAKLLPSFEQVAEAFQEFAKNLEQAGLIPSVTDEGTIE